MAETPLYLDYHRSVPERVHDLVKRMTLSEKVGQLSYTAPAIARLTAGQSQTLAFAIPPERMAGINQQGQAVMAAGRFQVAVGGCSSSAKAVKLGLPAALTASFRLV